jgi:hypothetical protein
MLAVEPVSRIMDHRWHSAGTEGTIGTTACVGTTAGSLSPCRMSSAVAENAVGLMRSRCNRQWLSGSRATGFREIGDQEWKELHGRREWRARNRQDGQK